MRYAFACWMLMATGMAAAQEMPPPVQPQPPAPPVMSAEEHDAFAEAVDLEPLRAVAVFHNGRVKILDTLARETVQSIFGKTAFTDRQRGKKYDPLFTLLDLTFNGAYYADKPLIYVENLPVRRALLAHLPPDEKEQWLRYKCLSPRMLLSEPVQQAAQTMIADIKKSKALGQVQYSLETYHATMSGEWWRVIPPAEGQTQWIALTQDAHTQFVDTQGTEQANRFHHTRKAWESLQGLKQYWALGDAEQVNRLALDLSRFLTSAAGEAKVSPVKLHAELWYNKTKKFTYIWPLYALSTIALLIAFATDRRWLKSTGIALLALAFIGHTAGLIVRMILAGRFTIHNQYESFITLSWFAVMAAVVFVIWKRQWLFGAAGAAVGAASLLIANTLPIPSSEVAHVAPILHTSRILYVHVNTVIISYALITLGFVISLFYLFNHYLHARSMARLAAAGLNEPPEIANDNARQTLLDDLDKAQMVVLQLAFWLLGVGILLGAYWADHSWGRWWGWDPKEVWALVTWIVYLIVIHLRFAVQRRGLVTAWLSVLGFFTMLWTHWGVNLLLSGLHSYA